MLVRERKRERESEGGGGGHRERERWVKREGEGDIVTRTTHEHLFTLPCSVHFTLAMTAGMMFRPTTMVSIVRTHHPLIFHRLPMSTTSSTLTTSYAVMVRSLCLFIFSKYA